MADMGRFHSEKEKIEVFLGKVYKEKYEGVDFDDLPLQVKHHITCNLVVDLEEENNRLKKQISTLEGEVDFLRTGLKLKK